jgi:hypothetical protein
MGLIDFSVSLALLAGEKDEFCSGDRVFDNFAF